MVTEYQAEILGDGNGRQFVALFPEGVTKAVQYGKELKAHAVYLSQYQLIPCKRIQGYFNDQLGIPVSEGSIYNFNREAGGVLKAEESERYRQWFRLILKAGEAECPPPDLTNRKGKRGRVKRTKARNLLERLQKFEDDALRFMDNKIVPFTNNLAENDLRMTKVQQKISGCFRSMEGAKYFCCIRGYLSTCRKQAIDVSRALKMLFRGELPVFAG